MSRSLLWILTVTTVLSVGNIYYSQPLLGEMAKAFGVGPAQVGTIPTLSQLGYVIGLLFVVPLGDVLEKRRLLVSLLCLAGVALLGGAIAPTFFVFAASAFSIGVTAVLVQIIIPFVALLSTPRERGRNLGTLLSGALIGVLISRTLSGFIGGALGWRGMYFFGAALMLVLALGLRSALPKHEPSTRLPYKLLLQSVWHLFRRLPSVRAIAFNGALMYAALSAFWASLAFYLQSPAHHLGPKSAGAFGLIGAFGALAANVAGRHAERIGPQRIVQACIWMMIAAFGVMIGFGSSLIGLIIGVVILDLGAQAATVSNQTQLYGLHAEAQTRLNTIYKICYFAGGAVGSGLSALAWQHYGWTGCCTVGIAFLLAASVWERFSPLNSKPTLIER